MYRKDILMPLRRFHGFLDGKWSDIKEIINKICYLMFPIGRKAYLIGTPEHTNVGDSAIVIAEQKCLYDCGILLNRLKEITINDYSRCKKVLKVLIRKREYIFLHGGGNMGDEWLGEEYFRRQVLKDFPNNKMIIFPQTIYYSNSEKGNIEKEKSVPFYNTRTNITVVAREKKSFEIMKKLYPECKVLLAPDIVLSTSKADWQLEEIERDGIVFCMRSDAERQINDRQQEMLETMVTNKGYAFRKIDMYSLEMVTKENRFERVKEKMKEFCGAELVITDRLHGMVFAAITGTPCIALGNYNQKVEGTYQWIKELPYVKFVKNVDDVEKWVSELTKLKNCKFDDEKLAEKYDSLRRVIKNETKRRKSRKTI